MNTALDWLKDGSSLHDAGVNDHGPRAGRERR